MNMSKARIWKYRLRNRESASWYSGRLWVCYIPAAGCGSVETFHTWAEAVRYLQARLGALVR